MVRSTWMLLQDATCYLCGWKLSSVQTTIRNCSPLDDGSHLETEHSPHVRDRVISRPVGQVSYVVRTEGQRRQRVPTGLHLRRWETRGLGSELGPRLTRPVQESQGAQSDASSKQAFFEALLKAFLRHRWQRELELIIELQDRSWIKKIQGTDL